MSWKNLKQQSLADARIVEQSKIQYYWNRNFQLPDVVTYMESTTNLTRQTVVDILLGIGDKLDAFKIIHNDLSSLPVKWFVNRWN